MNITTETIGELTCHIVDDLPEGATPKAIVVLCHGFGAPGTDLVGFAPELLERSPELAARIRFVFPEAPLELDAFGMEGGRAWWMLDVRRLQMEVATGGFHNLRNRRPARLDEARQTLMTVIDSLVEQTGVPVTRFVLGGFSQGAMLATECSLSLTETPAGLIILSGTLLCEEIWREQATRHAGLSVFQSHGTDDPILPYEAAVWLNELLKSAGADVTFTTFQGGHGIPLPVFEGVQSSLERWTNFEETAANPS